VKRAAAGLLALAGCFVTGDDSGDRCGGTSCAPGSLVWAEQAKSGYTVNVSAVANSTDEPPWFAGSVNRELQLRDDIYSVPNPILSVPYVARVDAREAPETWLGIASDDYTRSTMGVFPDGEEGAILITFGEELGAAWKTAAYRIDRHGGERPVQMAVLADMAAYDTRSNPVVTTRDGAGWPVVAISGSGIGIPPEIAGERAVVLRVMQELRTETVFDQAGVTITSIAPDTRDTLAIGGRYRGTPPGWPTCPEFECGFAAIIDAHVGAETPVRRLEVYRATERADVLGVGTDGAGRLTVMGRLTGEAIEPAFAGPPWPTLFLRFAGETESVTTALSFDAALDLSGAELVATDLGAVVALSFTGTILVDSPESGEVSSDGVDSHDMVISEYPAAFDGSGWGLTVRSDGDIAATALAVDGTQVAVGGNFTGLMSIATGTVLERASSSQGFVFELRR
jgi:hypothetical protein